ncbi:hypothetical protein B0H17DRAFT_1190269 [Mycena rosella]|uniref:Uncharacterized protein n=1 Tax=Mycena rosella TaxID=1033263 RepID=A0AAD7MCB6_MYCRO|nr:hypothetical protein B0H17DRAFT_1190269 [Mycena rosella]
MDHGVGGEGQSPTSTRSLPTFTFTVCAMASSQQQHPRPPSRPSAAPNARGMLSGRISALTASLRLHRGQDGEGTVHDDDDRNDEEAETESLASTLVEGGDTPSSRGYTSGRRGIGNFHPDALSTLPDEQDQEFPWPRGRPRERTRGSQSTGRGGYGNITSAPRNREWSYSTQEREILRAHAEARSVAIPVGRGGYGNIAHARALAAEAGMRSQSVDPVTAPMSMSFSVPVPMFGYRSRHRGKMLRLNGRDERHLSDTEESDGEAK